ncbi:MAG TPA: DUF3365 domain-containing protein [Burkholderiaceae bacterium]|nr:DUF3365 domain-containing protein [Burkholderiaceae bacterium]
MKYPVSRAVPALAALLLAGCAAPPPAPIAAPPGYLEDARKLAATVPANLLTVLTAELNRTGPAGAIEVCRDKAPEMARAASERSGWNVRRASLRNRNPKGVPDTWERVALERFDAQAAAGVAAPMLETYQVVSENGRQMFRYAKALPTQSLCVQCHGPVDKLSEPVKAKLRALYPNDRATGYEPGQIRGALFLKKPI